MNTCPFALLLLAILHVAAPTASAQAVEPPREPAPQVATPHDPYFQPTGTVVTDTMPRVILRNMRQDREGKIWFATFGGPICYDGKTFRNFAVEVGLAKTRIFSLLEDRSGALWFGSITGGASRFDGKSFEKFTTQPKNGQQALIDDDVLWLFEDRDGNLWFGTNAGLSRYDGKAMQHFTTKDGLLHDSIYARALRRVSTGTRS